MLYPIVGVHWANSTNATERLVKLSVIILRWWNVASVHNRQSAVQAVSTIFVAVSIKIRTAKSSAGYAYVVRVDAIEVKGVSTSLGHIAQEAYH